jgi:site-specific DNA recombinase
MGSPMAILVRCCWCRSRRSGRQYLLAGLVRCSLRKRRMQGQWIHGRAYYRCRYPLDYAVDEHEHPRSVYVRESAITEGLDPWLASLFDDDRIDETCEILAGASERDPDTEDRETRLRREIADVDRRLEGYRPVLNQGGDPAVVARWISDVQREPKVLVAQLGEPVPGGKLTKYQVRALVAGLRDIVSTLADADPEDKAELYRQLGITLTYSPDGRVNVQVLPRGVNVRVGGGTRTLTPRAAIAGEYRAAAA